MFSDEGIDGATFCELTEDDLTTEPFFLRSFKAKAIMKAFAALSQ